MSSNEQTGAAQALMAAIFVGEQAGEPVDLMAELRADDDARTMFNELVFLDRKLGGDFEDAAGEFSFLGALDAQLAEEIHDLPDNVVMFRRRRAFGAVALAAVALLATMFAIQPDEPDEFQARTAVTPKTSMFQKPSVHVFCVEQGQDGPVFRGADAAEFGVLRCSLDDQLKLAYTNKDPRLKYAAFFGVSPVGDRFWYGPSPATVSPVSVDITGDEPRAMGESVRLDVNHDAGGLRVYGVFTTRPMSFDQVKRLTDHSPNLYDNLAIDELGVVVSATMQLESR